MSNRNPLLDPQKGDLVHRSDGTVALVILVLLDDNDPDFGSETVHVREDTRWGQRRRASMSLSTWRKWAKGAEILDTGLADAFDEGGRKAVLGDRA